MTSQSVQVRSGVTTPVPGFLVKFNEVEMKPNNHLPLLVIPKGKEYLLEARNFLLSGPAKTALTINTPAVKELFFNLWATTLVITGETKKGTKEEYVSGFVPTKVDPTKLEEFSFTLRDFRDVLLFPAKPTDTKAFETLPSDDQLIEFLDEINYDWEAKIGKKLSSVKRGRITS